MTMKGSKDWIRQEMVDQAADEYVAANNCEPRDLTAFRLSKILGCHANKALYDKVNDWRRRRGEAAEEAGVDLPAGVEVAFKAYMDQVAVEATRSFVRSAREVAGAIDRAANLRVSHAERRQRDSESEFAELLQALEEAHGEIDELQVSVEAMKEALAEAQRREDRLLGRLDQCQVELANLGSKSAADVVAATKAVAPVPLPQVESTQAATETQLTMRIEPPEDDPS
ncbi:hypothetical protein ABIC65_001481 [Sphingomonas trueperi]|uniref:hypothetical protein n=1 Tax=Sphingomonas trueperi TaxID=53317 RepID=UPI003394AD22